MMGFYLEPKELRLDESCEGNCDKCGVATIKAAANHAAEESYQFVYDLDSLSRSAFEEKYGKVITDEGWENSWSAAMKIWLQEQKEARWNASDS